MALLSEKRIMEKEFSRPNSPDMSRVATIILGGGQGTRLAPLTLTQCKPAICFGGKYRLIDIPISNALNSGCHKIYVITQFLSAALHQHITRTYQLGHRAHVEILTAEQRPTKNVWFEGTADAVRQNLDYISEISADYFLILSGDQLYNFNFQHMLHTALESGADLTVGAVRISEADAKRMGVLKINRDHLITDFFEKPQDNEILDKMRMPSGVLEQMGKGQDTQRQHLGSMGIYLFKRKAIFDLLQLDTREDFGKHLIPNKVKQGKASAYVYDGYWEDIGTIESFYNANIAMTEMMPPLECYHEKQSIYFQPSHLPPAKIRGTVIKDALICDGAMVEADSVKGSILGLRTVVKPGTVIENSYFMGNDYYQYPYQSGSKFQIGEDCMIKRAILDKHVTLGRGVRLINKNNLKHYDSEHVFIRDGVIIVTRGASLPDGYLL